MLATALTARPWMQLDPDILGRTGEPTGPSRTLLPMLDWTVTAIEPGLTGTVPPIEDNPEAIFEAWRDYLG